MASTNIYDQGNDRTYVVSFNVKNTLLSDVDATGVMDYYIDVSTTMRQLDGTVYPHYVVRNLSDVPPGYDTATNFSNLCGKYISYFIDQTELIASSSSSSNSSSSSSEGYSSSSSS